MRRMRIPLRIRSAAAALAAALLPLAAAGWAPPAGAQTFGQNKVHYESLQWSVLETPHLRLHYYAEEESLARALAVFADSVCVEYEGRFRLRPKDKVPLLLYSTHHLFQQTNATPELITESVGGLTELIKGRVLIPHNGSWARLRWVTRHELTHWFMIEQLTAVAHVHKRPLNWYPPLWFVEGLAEYCGTTWDADAEGLLRDMVVSHLAFPVTQSEPITGSVMMYKEGQSFLLWLSAHYGDRLLFQLLENSWRGDDFETVFKLTYGRDLAALDHEWFDSLRKRYYPTVATCTKAADVARGFPQDSRFNLGPRSLPAASDSDTTVSFCFFTAEDDATDLMVSEPAGHGRRRERRLLRGGGTAAFESFHLFENRPSVSHTGVIAFTSKRGGRDALYLLDARRGGILRRFDCDDLMAIHDPAIAPDGSAVVFSAQDRSGRQDLYRVSWPGGAARLERLTHDDYDDVDPAISPDGRWVAFASDRGDLGGRYSLFRLSLAGGVPEPLSFPPAGDDRQPVYSPDGRWLAFRSTRGGTSDLWVRAAEPAHAARRVTRLLGPASDPDWLPHGHGLLFTAEEAITFRTYAIRFDPDTLAAEPEPEPAHAPVLPAVANHDPPTTYQRRLGLDVLQNGVAFDPGFGTGGLGQVAFSDLLGNEQILLALANDSEQFGDFWDGWEGGLTYLNQAQRLNYGVGLYRLTRIYDPDLDLIRREKRVGLIGLVSYPFSRFTRVEGSVQVRHATDHLLRDGDALTVDLVSNFASFVHDDSRWTWDGPVGGSRLNLTTGFTRDMTAGKADYGTLYGELRHYRQPLRNVVLASRVIGETNVGADAQRDYLGGPTRLHVSDRRVLAGLQVVSAQEELRFPLVRGLVLGIPAPWQLPTLYASAFADAAWTWDHEFAQRFGDAGYAVYFGGGFYPAIRWNWTWTSHDLRTFDSRRPSMFFSIAFNY